MQHRATLKHLSAASCFRREVPLCQVTLLQFVMCHVMVRSGPSWFILLPCENGYLLAPHRGLTTSTKDACGQEVIQDKIWPRAREWKVAMFCLAPGGFGTSSCTAGTAGAVPTARPGSQSPAGHVRESLLGSGRKDFRCKFRVAHQVSVCASFWICTSTGRSRKSSCRFAEMKQLSRPPPSWKPRRPRPRLPPAGGGRRHRRDPRHHHRC